MARAIDTKFKKSYKDEYDALYEAIYGQKPPTDDDQPYGIEDPEDELYKVAKLYETSRLQINLKKDTQDEKNPEVDQSGWATLPDLLLENVFSYLSMQEKYWASMVCKSWYRAFYLGNSWRTFVFDDKTLTRRRFDYYSGDQYTLDHNRNEKYLKIAGRHIRTLIFKPVANFHNFYEFMNMISFYTEQRIQLGTLGLYGIGSHIRSLQYTFPCNMATKNETKLYGTGGKLLDALKRLMRNLSSLRDLRLVDLMLDTNEALQLLDDICYSHCLTMQSLELVNISKVQCPLLHVGVFLNLQTLMISPQSLNDDVLSLLTHTSLRHLHIIQNSYTPTDVIPVSRRAWLTCKQESPRMQVHLYTKSHANQDLIWQESAPVHSILINSPQVAVKPGFIADAVDNYRTTLRIFGHLSISRSYQPRSFNERIDSHLLYLCRNCHNLHTLIIRDKISTATILLIAFSMKKLKFLHVRKNAVLLRSDWARNPDWSEDLYAWIKTTSRSYQATETEISSILGYRWKMLTDKEFLRIDSQTHFIN